MCVEVQVWTDTRNRNVSDLKVVVVGNVRQYILESEIKLQTMNVNLIKESGIAVKPGGISCREYSGETKSVKRIQESGGDGRSSYTISGMKTAPPCGGSHPAPKWDD